MSTLRTPDDLERQTVQESSGKTVAVSGHKGPKRTTPFGLDLETPPKNLECLSDRTAQCCFLCLQGKKYGQYAVRIPCFRPTKSRRVLYRQLVSTSEGMQSEKVTYEQLNPKENACESDASIYDRLREACFQHQNKWKQWIPFYGVVNVREVNFQFLGAPDRAGRFPIHIYPIIIDEVRNEADRTIALEPKHPDINDFCDGYWHSRECEVAMDVFSLPCINDQVKAARQRMKKLDVLYLLRDCARNPLNANGLRTLEGVAQESCIFDTK
ncbi:hypothetical protein K458DRAFT_315873 [Lentithecium fluviatile CBS 122367]|uniref:Uncharacterized protein n=1 Tax=Lentithecium fluviatile CBS 122367 TaxID=1168545 RepID=A0A6G1ILQ8_9PLEO|nr:hypothetical protein K458DRAFT_315873 [Lentithecium fluviatile CBS 122367]